MHIFLKKNSAPENIKVSSFKDSEIIQKRV